MWKLMCLPKWKDLKNIFSMSFNSGRKKKILADYFQSSALSKEMHTSLPSSFSFSSQAWRWLRFKPPPQKNPQNSFSLCVPLKISSHHCTIFHPSIFCSLRLSLSISLIFKTHLQKMEFPLMDAYYVCFNNHFLFWELVFCQQPKHAWDIFPDFQGVNPCFQVKGNGLLFSEWWVTRGWLWCSLVFRVAMKESG